MHKTDVFIDATYKNIYNIATIVQLPLGNTDTNNKFSIYLTLVAMRVG